MSDDVPVAIVRTRAEQRRRISLIWAIPLITAAIAAWLAWDTLAKRGPLITIRFDSASGLQANQSRIRLRDVELGVVDKVALSPDHAHVIVTARMTRDAWPLLTDKAEFWVVKPRLSAGTVTGLETLFSGAYIQLEMAADDGKPTTSFIGLEDPPVLHSSVPGHTYRLKSARVGSLNPGSPIFFRDLEVGEILGWDLGQMARDVTIHAFVRAPYDQYVHDETVFWNASGASIELGGNGVKVQLESLRALLLGGVQFDTPQRAQTASTAAEDHQFILYADQQAADSASYGRTLRFVSYFNGSVAGLSTGSSVTLHGLTIGMVTDVALNYDKATDTIRAEVQYSVEPDRINSLDLPQNLDLGQHVAELLHRGLRVRLESGSLITGSKQLVMDFIVDAPEAPYEKIGDAWFVPTAGGDQGDLMASVNALLARVQSIPFEQIGDNLNQTLSGANGTINNPRLRQAIESLADTLSATQTLMTSANKGLDPLLRRLPKIADDLEGTVKHANSLVGSLDGNQANGSQFGRDLNRTLSQLSDAARSVRILADLLSRHPEALIRGRTAEGSQ